MSFYKLNTNTVTGLSKEDVKERLKIFGHNIAVTKENQNIKLLKIIFKQFTNPLILILIIATMTSFLIQEHTDAFVIISAIIINICVGFIQEWEADKAFNALKKFEIPYCKVKRDNKIVLIKTVELVPGDVVLLSAGDTVPADLKLIYSKNLIIDESIITGESKPVEKNLNTENLELLAGTSVFYGKAEGIVTKTGEKSTLGKIAKIILETEKTQTPLQQQIEKLSIHLGILFISLAIIIFLIGIFKNIPINKIIMTSIALAVAAIPEGLLIAVTAILAIGMKRMLKKKALIRHLIAVETLGSVSIICTDKTGTLTEGKMQVTQIITNQNKSIEEIITYAILNNDAQIQENKKTIGYPIDIALLEKAKNFNINIEQIRSTHPRINEIPFSPKIKYMVTINKFDKHEKIIVKGAPEEIFKMCAQPEQINYFQKILTNLSTEGLHTIAIAEKILPGNYNKINLEQNLNNLNITGLFGIIDPLRTNAKDTIKKLTAAGIQIILITGDHKQTAMQIATKLELMHNNNNEILTGEELKKISNQEFLTKITQIKIFARVEPEQKIKIIKAWQTLGKSVAMIGDGVNDAPALKASDIGVALGSGSEVAQEISDIILLNNNLASISIAVKEGRIIFENIRKIILFLLFTGLSEIIFIGIAVLANLPLPLTPSQILWINLISHGFTYIALTLEPGEPDIMNNPPRKKTEAIIDKKMKTLIFAASIITDLFFILIYLYMLSTNTAFEKIRTIIFTALSLSSPIFAFSFKNIKKTIFKINIFSNRYLFYALCISIIAQLTITYTPVLQKVLKITELSVKDWFIILPLILIKFLAIELTKKFLYKKK